MVSPTPYKIIIDTREQQPLWKETPGRIEFSKLDTGDYSIEGLTNKIGIERKSPGDLFGTLGKGHKRFQNELERAKKLDFFAIVIETNYKNINDKSFPGGQFIRMKGFVINKILATLTVKYGIHVYYCNGRVETKAVVRELLNAYWRNKDFFLDGDEKDLNNTDAEGDL